MELKSDRERCCMFCVAYNCQPVQDFERRDDQPQFNCLCGCARERFAQNCQVVNFSLCYIFFDQA